MGKKQLLVVLLFLVSTVLLQAETVGIVYKGFSGAVRPATKFLVAKNKTQDRFEFIVEGDADPKDVKDKYDFLLIVLTDKKVDKEYTDYVKKNEDTSLILWYQKKGFKKVDVKVDGVDVIASPTPKSKAKPFVEGNELDKAIAKRLDS